MILDNWQKEILETKGNIVLRAGRQVGKSTIISILAAEEAIKTRNFSVMIISATERQAYLLFSKVLLYLDDNYRNFIKSGKDRPTKSEIKLKNGSVIRCLPTGSDGLGIRGYTINLLIADEAAFINEAVFPSVTPALLTTGGRIILLSTPFGRQGYFFKRFSDPNFKPFHIKTPDVAEKREEPQRTYMTNFIESQKKVMSRVQFAQEIEGEFVDELRQLFPDELIKKVCTLRRANFISNRTLFCGVDVAALGKDYGTIEIIAKLGEDNFEQIENEILVKKYTTETSNRIKELNKIYQFRKIGVDDGGCGFGVLSDLINDSETKRKTFALNNASREIDYSGEKSKRLLKEEMYFNMLALMEKGKLKLLDDDEILLSLKSIQYEYVITESKKTSLRIWGEYSHCVEGLIRACWLANQKSINMRIEWI